MKVNHKSSTERAYEVLLLNDNITIPINPLKIKLNDIILKIFSMQYWSKLHNIPLNEMTRDGKYNEGYTEFYNANGKKYAFVFYNEEVESEGRKKFTIAHEIGHIVLQHNRHIDEYEKEADIFASQLLLPHCVLEELFKKGKYPNEKYLQEKFGLSRQAASISIKQVGKKMDNNAYNEYEDIILEKFKNFINLETRNCKYNYEKEFDEMETIRNSW